MTTKAKPTQISHARLLEVLHYDPDTGIFTWLVNLGTRARAGNEAGRVDPRGYRRIRVDGHEYLTHRLAWFYMTGVSPEHEIDHRDGDPGNNRFGNLREATRGQNTANTRLRIAKTLPKGVTASRNGKRFIAQIVHDGETIYLGTHDTPDQAHRFYMTAARDLHGDFARAS